MSQLNPPGGVDFRDLVLNCTTVKQYFSARDPALQRYLGDVSGTVLYHSAAWDQFKRRVLAGDVRRNFACSGPDGHMRMTIKEHLGNRLEGEDIRDVNRESNQSILLVERGQGYSQLVGAFPVHTDWPMPQREHERRSFELPWPAVSDETIEIAADWPEENEHTVVATTHPGLDPPPGIEQVAKPLEEIRRAIEGE